MKSSVPTALARLYDDLARYQWWRRRLHLGAGRPGLEMHKRLVETPNGASGGAPAVAGIGLNAWLWSQLPAIDSGRVLDLGAGFGATMFEWLRHAPDLRFVGLGLSPYQAGRARSEAKRRGHADSCEFLVQDNSNIPSGPFQVAVSIETLFHAAELDAVFTSLAPALASNATFALVEDMAIDGSVAKDSDGEALLRLWSTDRLHTADDYRASLARAGFSIIAEHDLTREVASQPLTALDERNHRLARAGRFLPNASLRGVIDAFRGGLHLERLYARDKMRYRAIFARPSEVGSN